MMDDPAIHAIAALDDDLRRGMYEFIRGAHRPVTRDEAAAAVGISRKLAAFHLDKLVETGALRAHYAAPGRIRRVGRMPKVYEPSGMDIRVNIPPRSYDLLAGILLDAVLAEPQEEGNAQDAAMRVAREHGYAAGVAERQRSRWGWLGPGLALTLISGMLEHYGFEPGRSAAPDRVLLRNCPFHPFAARSPELVCGINLGFLSGVIDGLETSAIEAILRPCPGQCCVELHARS